MKKKIGIALLVCVLAAGTGAGVWYFKFRGNTPKSASEEAVFVDSVGVVTGLTDAGGVRNRFAGVVEPQETIGVDVANGLKVKETYVTVGQEVEVGTKLFSYDTEEAQDSITQLEIDIENSDISIESSKAQITQLEKEKNKVSADEKLSYTTQIMTIENSIKRSEYEKKSKLAEMESLKKQIANSVVKSEQKGIVKSINKDSASGGEDSAAMYGMYGMSQEESDSHFITIMATGEYRVKGSINEQNMMQVSEGTPVIVHSRTDESLTWKGMLGMIDRDKGTTNQNNMYYGNSDSSMTNSSSYPFYIELESSEGLMLGQHVYIVPDDGQEETRDGMWLNDYYFITDENGEVTPYVWAANEKDRLEKREVTLGEYDEELMKYEVTAGLTAEDYIAFPADNLTEGSPVTRNTDMMGGMTNMGGAVGMEDSGMAEEWDDGSMEMEPGMAEEGLWDEGLEYYEEDPGMEPGDLGEEWINDGSMEEEWIEEDFPDEEVMP